MRKDGSLVDVDVYGVGTRDEDRPAIIGMLLNVTERCTAEREVANQLGFITQLVATIPCPVFFKDEAGRYLACNTAVENHIGINRANLLGRSVHDISPKDLANKYFAADQALFDNPGTQISEAAVTYADGSRHDVAFNKPPLARLTAVWAGWSASFSTSVNANGWNEPAVVDTLLAFRDAGIQVVAEGVETEAQCALLRLAGCDYAQGYLFSRPLPAAEFQRLFDRQPAAGV